MSLSFNEDSDTMNDSFDSTMSSLKTSMSMNLSSLSPCSHVSTPLDLMKSEYSPDVETPITW